jgi:hypothetical protein
VLLRRRTLKREALKLTVLPVIVIIGLFAGYAIASTASDHTRAHDPGVPKRVTPKVEFGTVTTADGSYEVESYGIADGEICLEATYEADQPPHLACGPKPTAETPLGLVVTAVTPDGNKLVYGITADSVASVDIEVPGAQAKRLHPKAQAVSGHVFIAKVAKKRGIRVVARNARGKVIASVGRQRGDG